MAYVADSYHTVTRADVAAMRAGALTTDDTFDEQQQSTNERRRYHGIRRISAATCYAPATMICHAAIRALLRVIIFFFAIMLF